MSFKKEFIVSKIDIPEDKSPYVYVSIYSKGNFYPSRRQQGFPENQFGVAAIPITSLEDLKNLPKKISDAIDSAFGGGKNNISTESTTLKMNAREFKELGIETGDKVMVEIKISDRNDIQP